MHKYINKLITERTPAAGQFVKIMNHMCVLKYVLMFYLVTHSGLFHVNFWSNMDIIRYIFFLNYIFNPTFGFVRI